MDRIQGNIMSTLKVDTILKRTGTGTITLGQSGDTIALGSGASQTLATNTPVFSISRPSDQTGVSDATETRVQFNSVQFDTASAWDGTNYWWVVPSAGKYFISFKVRCSSGGNNKMDVATVFLNGGASGTTGLDLTQLSDVTNHYDYITIGYSGIYSLSASDKINVTVNIDNDGGTSRIDGNATYNYTNLHIAKVIE